jgi:hypothetical protein
VELAVTEYHPTNMFSDVTDALITRYAMERTYFHALPTASYFKVLGSRLISFISGSKTENVTGG